MGGWLSGKANFNTMFRNSMFGTDVGFDVGPFIRVVEIIGNASTRQR